jgi:hypothetical protein
MNISPDYLAELLAGIARAQTAVIDAIDRAQPGFKTTHAIPLIQLAANMRLPQARLVDLPSRILMRTQNRATVDIEAIKQDLERLASGAGAPAPGAAPTAPMPSAVASEPASGGDNLDFSAKE